MPSYFAQGWSEATTPELELANAFRVTLGFYEFLW